jgi:hypothetical protein
MSLEAALSRLPGGDVAADRPLRLDLCDPTDRARLEGLLAAGAIRFCHDTVRAQLRDLVRAAEPARVLSEMEVTARIEQHLGGRSLHEYGTWAYYPWSGRLVHLLPEHEFVRLRSDRNRYKITAAEQERLRRRRIGVIGLSVGQAAALTLALEGVGGSFRLADFDALDLSNMNRLRAGVHDLGLNKATLAARQMYEIDPYLDITVFTEGLRADAVDEFLLGGGRLDLVVEECDDLAVKVQVRERARHHGIPVIMETSDRGLLDIERFDLEPRRPLLHGALGDLDAVMLSQLSFEERLPYVLAFVGARSASTDATASFLEVRQTLATWPQLGSAVALGGALVTDAARRLLLGHLNASGRFYVDLERLVADGAQSPLGQAQLDPGVAAEASAAPAPLPVPAVPARGPSVEPSRDEVRYLVAHAALAPSGGNAQPWRFVARGRRIACFVDDERGATKLAPARRASYLALGAAVENLVLAAGGLGFAVEVKPLPEARDPLLGCELILDRQGSRPAPGTWTDPLLDQVHRRVTNRRRGTGQPLSAEDASALGETARRAGAAFDLVSEREALTHLGTILGESDRLRFFDRQLHEEFVREVRWTPRDVLLTRDGLDVATLEMSPADRAILDVLTSWPVMERLSRLGGGGALIDRTCKATAAAAAIGRLRIAETGPRGYFLGGRALQRVWLEATARALALQPHIPVFFYYGDLETGGDSGFTAEEVRTLQTLRARYHEFLAPVAQGHTEIFLFRLSHAGPPTARSLRRPVDDILRFAD